MWALHFSSCVGVVHDSRRGCCTVREFTSILDLAAVGVLQSWLDSPTFTLKFAMLESSRKACYVYEGP